MVSRAISGADSMCASYVCVPVGKSLKTACACPRDGEKTYSVGMRMDVAEHSVDERDQGEVSVEIEQYGRAGDLP